MTAIISDAHARCYFAFEELLDTLGNPARDYNVQLPPRDVQEVFDKYKIWAGNVGAAHSGKRFEISLDYRLREASFFRSQVLSILRTLEGKIQDATSLLRNERKPFEEQAPESDGETSDSATSALLEGDEEGSEDSSPWDISSRSSGDSGRSRRSISRLAPESQGPSGLVIPVEGKHSPMGTVGQLAQLPTSEMPRLLESIKFSVSCLYRIPIRKPAPLDRIKHSTTHNLSTYQHFDVLYVRDKFPGLDEALATRIGKMITRRRQILYYREAHKQSLDTARVQPRVVRDRPAGPNSFVIHAGPEMQTILLDEQPTSSRLALSKAASSQFTLRTKATTVRLGDLDFAITPDEIDPAALYAPSIAESKSSMASSFAGKDLNVEIPSRPKDDDGKELDMFECPYCLITKSITSSHKWKKHVLEDIQPYICTFDGCELYDHFFDSRDDWYKHELQQHRTKWYCNTDGHQDFEDETAFLSHMRNAHETKFDSAQFTSVKDMFRHPSRTLQGTCNLCMRPSNKLRSHVSRHLQQMALFALPRANQTAGSGKAEQNSAKSRLQMDDDGDAKEKSTSRSDHSSSLSDTSENDGNDDGQDKDGNNVDHDDEYEVKDVPDIVEANWDNITDKFSKARERSYRPLLMMLLGLSPGLEETMLSLLRYLGCEAFLAVPGELKPHFDIVFMPRDLRNRPESFNTGHREELSELPGFKIGIIDLEAQFDPGAQSDPSDHDFFDDTLPEPIQGLAVLSIIRKLCYWEPPPDLQQHMRMLEHQLQIVCELQLQQEFDIFGEKLDFLESQLNTRLVDIAASPYPSWESFESFLLGIPGDEEDGDSVAEEMKQDEDGAEDISHPRGPRDAESPQVQRGSVVRLLKFRTQILAPYVVDYIGRVEEEMSVGGRWWYEIKPLLERPAWFAEDTLEEAPEERLLDVAVAAFINPNTEDIDLTRLWIELSEAIHRDKGGTKLAQVIETRFKQTTHVPQLIALVDLASRVTTKDWVDSDVYRAFGSDSFTGVLLDIATRQGAHPDVISRIREYTQDSAALFPVEDARIVMKEAYDKLYAQFTEDGHDRIAKNNKNAETVDDNYYDAATIDHFVMPLLRKQLDLMVSMITTIKQNPKTGPDLISPVLVKILNHLKLSAFPFLRWETFRQEISAAAMHACSGIIGDGVSVQLAWFKRHLEEKVSEGTSLCSDMPFFAKRDLVSFSVSSGRDNHETIVTEVMDRRFKESRWQYLVAFDGDRIWSDEPVVKLIKAASPPREAAYDFSVYEQEEFLPFICWFRPECVLAFKSEQERNTHFRFDQRSALGCKSHWSDSPHDRKYQLEHEYAPSVKRRAGWFCRHQYCIDDFPIPTARDQHELSCKRYTDYEDRNLDESVSKDPKKANLESSDEPAFYCRDGCGQKFDEPFSPSRDTHEMSCPVFPKICRNDGCVLSFNNSEARLMHEQHRCAFDNALWRSMGLRRVKCTNDGCDMVFGSEAYCVEHEAKFCKHQRHKRIEGDVFDYLDAEVWQLSAPPQEDFAVVFHEHAT